jgi:hypothetical protein
MQEIMGDASGVVRAGLRLRSDAKIIRWPDRYMDPRGERIWNTVIGLLPQKAQSNPGK